MNKLLKMKKIKLKMQKILTILKLRKEIELLKK